MGLQLRYGIGVLRTCHRRFVQFGLNLDSRNIIVPMFLGTGDDMTVPSSSILLEDAC
jgi:hypothetical protein